MPYYNTDSVFFKGEKGKSHQWHFYNHGKTSLQQLQKAFTLFIALGFGKGIM